MKKVFIAISILFVLAAHAQDESAKALSVNAELVSTYVWRGSYIAGTSIQPSMDWNVGSFTAGAWGSVDIAGFGYKEVDLFVSYSYKNFTLGIFDIWVAGERAYNYFDFSKTTVHVFDAWLTYSFKRIPLNISWYTAIAGDETYTKHYTKNGKLKKAFPTYIEATHFFQIKDINLEATIAVSPWNSSVLYNRYDDGGRTNGFAVVNMSLKLSKELKMTDTYALPVFGQLIYNPAKEDSFFVFGIKF